MYYDTDKNFLKDRSFWFLTCLGLLGAYYVRDRY